MRTAKVLKKLKPSEYLSEGFSFIALGIYLVAFSSFFIIENMKIAETKHKPIKIDQSIHNGISPHNIPIIETK